MKYNLRFEAATLAENKRDGSAGVMATFSSSEAQLQAYLPADLSRQFTLGETYEVEIHLTRTH